MEAEIKSGPPVGCNRPGDLGHKVIGHPMTVSKNLQAGKLGHDAGIAAASWVFDGSTADETYATVLTGLDDGDPAVYDMFREPSFSGEYAGDYSERDLCDDLDVDYDLAGTSEVDELADAYLDAARASFWSEVERLARAAVDYGEHDCPCCGDATYDGSQLLCSSCRAADCQTSRDAGGDTGFTNCQRDDTDGES